jgi:hypothetical protein
MPIGFEHVQETVRKAYQDGAYRRLDLPTRVAIYICREPLKAGSTFTTGPNRHTAKQDAYLVFVDLLYEANFVHPVLYELHAAKDGAVTRIEEENPILDPGLRARLLPLVVPEKGGA